TKTRHPVWKSYQPVNVMLLKIGISWWFWPPPRRLFALNHTLMKYRFNSFDSLVSLNRMATSKSGRAYVYQGCCHR
ncbi:MAG: hypothetical protein RR836_19890, partial [Aeromonas sp.]|uniref:hypothetical protein n=1 Tax=Aeromonas sp. TaxID=647 RepID=UPI002FCCA47D